MTSATSPPKCHGLQDGPPTARRQCSGRGCASPSRCVDARRRAAAHPRKGDAFTTQELVKEAGVALQTFYRYFASKDELLLAVIADAMADACDALGRPPPWAAGFTGPAAVLHHRRHRRLEPNRR